MKTQTELRVIAGQLIDRERQRQIDAEGYDERHDDRHTRGEIGQAAQVYFDCAVLPGHADNIILAPQRTPGVKWPWDWQWFKPWEKTKTGPRVVDSKACLIKAGALVQAEKARLDRMERKITASLYAVLQTDQHADLIQLKPGARGLADS